MASKTNLDSLEITWLTQSAFKIKGGGLVVYVDPINDQEDEKAELILITHEHEDHCDPVTVEGLRKENTTVLASYGAARKLKGGATIVYEGDALKEKGVEITVVPAYNEGKEYHRRDFGVGYLINIEGKKIYHAGDTDFIPMMNDLEGIDLALLPIGGTFTMNPTEGAEAAVAIGPKIVIPMHYGTIVGVDTMADKFKKMVEEQAGGSIEVRVLSRKLNGEDQMGPEVEETEAEGTP